MPYEIFAPIDAWMNTHRVFMTLLPFIIFGLLIAYARLILEPRQRLEEQLRVSEILRRVERELRIEAGEGETR